MLVATDIYDVLAGQTALDVFHQDLYPSGDPETRGGMYSRAKGYGGLAQLANAYLQMAGLPPTQENYNMAFKALGAGAAIPVTQEVPEGKSAMTAYFDRLLGRTPKEEEKKETLKEIMIEDEGSEPDFDTTAYPYDPTDWRDITREAHNLYTAYGPMDFFGKALGIPGGWGTSSEENKEREKKVREIEELMYTKEVVDAYEKAQKEKGTTFSPTGMLEKVGEFLTGMADPARNLYDEERQAALTDAFGKAIGFDDKAYEGWSAADIARAGEIDLETTAEEAKLNKEAAKRKEQALLESAISAAYENYLSGNISQARYQQLMELGNIDPDTGKPSEPTGDMTGKTGSELVDLISDIGLWGPDDPSAYDPSDLHSDLQKALGYGDPIAAALGPAGYGKTQAEIDKAAAELGKGYAAEQKALDKLSAEARAKENKPDGDDVNPDTGKTTEEELTQDWHDDPDAMF
jgi:hypothetical protein